MKLFFATLEEIHFFTMNLKLHCDTLSCKHCKKSNQFVSHGYVYKEKGLYGYKIRIGKRILCSNRFRKTGCGRSTRLYLANQIPQLQFTVSEFYSFLLALISNFSVKTAYHSISNAEEARNAYRWIKKLKSKVIIFRTQLRTRFHQITEKFSSARPQFKILVSTIEQLFKTLGPTPCCDYQLRYQTNFL